LDNNNLVEDISDPKTHAEKVPIEPVTHQNNKIGSYIEFISHEIQHNSIWSAQICPNLIHQR